ncbi:MAG: 1-acyl-sn-glycerol-3-phosphate acyltransferase [Bacteroidales bacterium]|nr:1-acyl-sn-glycerol-3-phosphate acyltransferase [Bacteroidales bacterium]
MEQKPLSIDIDAIVKAKTSKHIPQCLINLLKRVVHQDEINAFLKRDLHGVDFFQGVLDLMQCSDSVAGAENLKLIPDGQSAIFASNHPLGALEAMVMGKHFGEIYGTELNFVVNEFLMYLTPIANYFTPVDVASTSVMKNRNAKERLQQLFASKKHVVMFPSGAASRRIDGIVQDKPWKKTFVTMAKEHHRCIVPVKVDGRNSIHFYLLAKLRELLGIKFSYEMLLLPDEMFRQRGKTISITIGKPIEWENLMSVKDDWTLVKLIRQKVYSL